MYIFIGKVEVIIFVKIVWKVRFVFYLYIIYIYVYRYGCKM